MHTAELYIYIYIYIHIYINFPVTSPEDSVETCVLDFYPCFDIRHNWDDRVSSTRRSHFTLGTHNWTRPYLEWNPEPEPPALWSSASTNCATACPIVTPRTSCYYWNWNLHWEIQMLCISRYRVNSSYISKPEGMTKKRMGQLKWPVTVNMKKNKKKKKTSDISEESIFCQLPTKQVHII